MSNLEFEDSYTKLKDLPIVEDTFNTKDKYIFNFDKIELK